MRIEVFLKEYMIPLWIIHD